MLDVAVACARDLRHGAAVAQILADGVAVIPLSASMMAGSLSRASISAAWLEQSVSCPAVTCKAMGRPCALPRM